MKPTTEVVLGYRNIGDSKDQGTIVPAAPLKEQLLHLIQHLGNVTMATRLQISIARNESDARRGIEPERKSRAGNSMADDLAKALASMGVRDADLDETLDLSGDDGWVMPKL